jgi:acyl-CoA thioesterase
MADDTTPEETDPRQFSRLIGLEMEAMDDGHSRSSLAVTEQLQNPFGVLHGGVLYAMADTGMGAALYPGLEGDERCATIEIKISYMQAVTEGTVTCETDVIKRGRRVAYLESDLTNDGDLVAQATGSFSIFTPDG